MQGSIELLNNKLVQEIRIERVCKGLCGTFQKEGEKNEDEDVDLFDSLALSLSIFSYFFSYMTYHNELFELYFNEIIIILSII